MAAIAEQLQQERIRKESIEQRGLAIVTSSGFLATASGPTKWIVGLSVILFLAAAALGIWSVRLRGYQEIKVEELRRLVVDDLWRAAPFKASQRLGEVQIKVLEDARGQNDDKAFILKLAMWAVLLAIGSVSASVIVLLFGS